MYQTTHLKILFELIWINFGIDIKGFSKLEFCSSVRSEGECDILLVFLSIEGEACGRSSSGRKWFFRGDLKIFHILPLNGDGIYLSFTRLEPLRCFWLKTFRLGGGKKKLPYYFSSYLPGELQISTLCSRVELHSDHCI